jgi:hypothetical protein
MSKPKTDYNPDNYNRESYANIMQYIFADLMISHDREGFEGFMATHAEVNKIRNKINGAYVANKQRILIQRIAEGVLLWLRNGATVDQVISASNGKLLKRARKLG